jgi:hypothetical protein
VAAELARRPTATPIVKEVIKEVIVTPIPTISPTPTPLPKVGYSRANPADIGTGVFVKFTVSNIGEFEARITVLEVTRGKEAEELVEAPYGGPESCPTCYSRPGFERLLVRIRFELLRAKDADTFYSLQLKRYANVEEFEAVSSDGKVYESVNYTVRFKDRREDLAVKLYGGASHEGWKIFHVAQHDTSPLMHFIEDGWWKLYK